MSEPRATAGLTMAGVLQSFSYQQGALATGMDVGVLKRLQRQDLLSSPAERRGRGADGEMSFDEIVRAAAYAHFQASGVRPDKRERGWLLQHAFNLRQFFLVRRDTHAVILIGQGDLIQVVREPGSYVVFDPSPILGALGLEWDWR